jgi:hypothetical protein
MVAAAVIRSVAGGEKAMSRGAEIWASAERIAQEVSEQSAQWRRFQALNRMLAEAENSATRSHEETVQKLRELQAHCEKLIGVLSPEKCGRPKLVAA